MADELRRCGHPLGSTRSCPDCELAEMRAPRAASPAVAPSAQPVQQLLDECAPFLKDGETPAECIARNRRDAKAVFLYYSDALRWRHVRDHWDEVCGLHFAKQDGTHPSWARESDPAKLTAWVDEKIAAIGAAPSAQQPQAAGVSERDLPPLPQSLLDAIGEYGMARTDGVGEVERLHRWELLIAGIKRYARSLLSTTSAPAQAEQPALAAAAHALTVFSAIHKAHWTHWTGHEHQDADKALGALRRAVAEQHGGAA